MIRSVLRQWRVSALNFLDKMLLFTADVKRTGLRMQRGGAVNCNDRIRKIGSLP